jgi:precorrin-6B methylase 2
MYEAIKNILCTLYMTSLYKSLFQVKSKNIANIFPQTNNYDMLKYDDDTLTFISTKYQARRIIKIIKMYLSAMKKNIKILKIVDATACIGGDTISFAKYFNHVYSIEMDKVRYEWLKNNVNVYGIKNVTMYSDDSTRKLFSLPIYHMVFIDPPWGGSDYKNQKTITLALGSYKIEELVNKLLEEKEDLLLVVLKLPINYDLNYLRINIKFRLNIHVIKNILLAVISKS